MLPAFRSLSRFCIDFLRFAAHLFCLTTIDSFLRFSCVTILTCCVFCGTVRSFLHFSCTFALGHCFLRFSSFLPGCVSFCSVLLHWILRSFLQIFILHFLVLRSDSFFLVSVFSAFLRSYVTTSSIFLTLECSLLCSLHSF